MALPSAKLCTLVEIVTHHLSTDNTQPLRIAEGGTVHVNPNAPVTECAAGLPKDRIVIYSAFPSSSDIIIGVSI